MVMRFVSCSLAAKCLAMAMIPLAWTALISATAIVPVRYGSSPKYSKLRPRTGIRAMFTPGASNTCSARLLASVPITLPNSLATAGSKDAARAMAGGRVGIDRDVDKVATDHDEDWRDRCRNTIVLTDADRAVGDAQRRNCQRRNSSHVAAALALRQFRKDPRQRPDQLLLLLRERHGANQQCGPLFGRKRRVHPRQRL